LARSRVAQVIIYGDSYDVESLRGHRIREFRISETVYRSGKVEITSWEAKVEDEDG